MKNLLEIAIDNRTPGSRLAKLAKETKDLEVLSAIARNQNTPRRTLIKLTKAKNWEIRWKIAANTADPNILEQLSEDIYFVKKGLAINDRTPPRGLEKLSNSSDIDEDIEELLAENKNTPESVLLKLSKHPNWVVRFALAQNDNCPEYILEILAKDNQYEVREEVIFNQNTSDKILEILVKDKQMGIRLTVADRTNLSPNILAKLATDPDAEVREPVKSLKSNNR